MPMNNNKIYKELLNDAVFKSIYSTLKPEEQKQIDQVIISFCSIASESTDKFTTRMAASDITDADVATALSDKPGKL